MTLPLDFHRIPGGRHVRRSWQLHSISAHCLDVPGYARSQNHPPPKMTGHV